MVQSVNTKAIMTLTTILRRPALLVPHVSVSNISEVIDEQCFALFFASLSFL